ncbi:hypothetical protein BWQ96_07451 [Gracilariopsis chorda]|uniref:Uncharacterized protein n=1 Tax=Gracilariopsis chorda TaxID=448386 RepID=A0A2V3INU4_9FLOR|nr:hypothetical protein BWQ96_07451 [Gracilariopsis chorda]|eukprot:PXF42800.1 hypothetical protein BWQ96_07451 [Gracilariopsis chorda]
MLSRSRCLWISLIFLVAYAEALTHLHKGPQHDGEEFVLRGFTHGSASSSTQQYDGHIETQSNRTVSFSVDLKMDAVLWEELEDDNIEMSTCIRHGNTHDVRIELIGERLDPEDYVPGSAFVIDAEHWEKLCGSVPFLRGIDGQDPVLFFRMTNVTELDSAPKLRLDMTAVPGSFVAPSVQFDVLERPLKQHTQKRYMFHDSPLYSAASRMLEAPIGSLPGDISHSGSEVFSEFAIFPGANISLSGVVEGNIRNVRITRLFQLEVSWEQNVKADISSRFIASRMYSASNEREVHRKPIQGATSSGRIAFFGRYSVTASTVVNIVQEVQADSGVNAFLRASHENIEAVTASFASNEMEAESLVPPDFGSYGTFDINFDNVINQHIGINGFYGARTGIVVDARLAGISLVGTYTATLGLDASMQMRYPPFSPVPHSGGRVLGTCQECHRLQGRASVKGKDLQYYIHENGVLQKHKVLDQSLFEKEFTTVCAFAQVCPV